MKNNYTFCRKDGNLKQSYVPICKYIVESEFRKHQLTKYRYDEVIEEYYCYSTPYKFFIRRKEKDNYISKIREICKNFKIRTKEWVYPDLLVELHGENVEIMINELRKLLGGDNHFR